MNSNVKTALILIALILIIRVVAFFSGSETAYLSITKMKLKRLVTEKRRGAKTALELKKNMDELLSIVLIGTNFMNTLASALGTSLAVSIAGNSGVGIATLIITFCATTFGQIIPKTAAGVFTEKTACKSAFSLRLLELIFFPVVWLFSRISKTAAFFAERFFHNSTELVTEEELKTLIDVGEKEGTLEKGEKQMLYKLFEISDLEVHKIMKHRSLVQAVSVEASRAQVVLKFKSSGLKMIAVYEESPENVTGVIHYKSVLLSGNEIEDTGKFYAQKVMKGVLFVPETISALDLLGRFKKEHTEFAVALDEQGCTSGVVTMDDIMRSIFGRMMDEKEQNLQPEARIKFISAKEVIVPGDMKIEDVNAILHLNLESEECVTCGGWLLEQFGFLPQCGEIINRSGKVFIVEEQAQRKIIRIRIKL